MSTTLEPIKGITASGTVAEYLEKHPNFLGHDLPWEVANQVACENRNIITMRDVRDTLRSLGAVQEAADLEADC